MSFNLSVHMAPNIQTRIHDKHALEKCLQSENRKKKRRGGGRYINEISRKARTFAISTRNNY